MLDQDAGGRLGGRVRHGHRVVPLARHAERLAMASPDADLRTHWARPCSHRGRFTNRITRVRPSTAGHLWRVFVSSRVHGAQSCAAVGSSAPCRARSLPRGDPIRSHVDRGLTRPQVERRSSRAPLCRVGGSCLRCITCRGCPRSHRCRSSRSSSIPRTFRGCRSETLLFSHRCSSSVSCFGCAIDGGDRRFCSVRLPARLYFRR